MAGTTRTLPRQLVRYLMVGGLGFAIDGTVLYVLVAQGTGPYIARLLSFAVAVTVTWRLHRLWTFATRSVPGAKREYMRYFIVQILGVLTNYAAYAGVLQFVAPTAANAVLALAAGATIGLVVNFAGSRWFAFRGAGALSSARHPSG